VNSKRQKEKKKKKKTKTKTKKGQPKRDIQNTFTSILWSWQVLIMVD